MLIAKSSEIDRMKRLRDERNKGHNCWHPDIMPVIEAEPGEEVTPQSDKEFVPKRLEI